MTKLFEATTRLLEILGHDEEPLGVVYSDEKPDGPGPKPGPLLSREAEANGTLDAGAVWSNFSCVMGRILLARKKKIATWLAADAYGCVGASFYAGFHRPQLEMIVHYISTGIPGAMEGERFLRCPEDARNFFNTLEPAPAPKKYCIIKPLSLFGEDEEPAVIAFFGRGEVLGPLCTLASFATGSPEAVTMPFGAGCANIIAWPLHYQAQNREVAVLGGNDLSCRGLFNIDEWSLAMATSLYRKMLEAVPESFFCTELWSKCQKRIVQSDRQWSEPKQ